MRSLLTLLHSEKPKLYMSLAFLCAIGLIDEEYFGSLMSFSTVFQPFQNDRRVIVKGSIQ